MVKIKNILNFPQCITELLFDLKQPSKRSNETSSCRRCVWLLAQQVAEEQHFVALTSGYSWHYAFIYITSCTSFFVAWSALSLSRSLVCLLVKRPVLVERLLLRIKMATCVLPGSVEWLQMVQQGRGGGLSNRWWAASERTKRTTGHNRSMSLAVQRSLCQTKPCTHTCGSFGIHTHWRVCRSRCLPPAFPSCVTII